MAERAGRMTSLAALPSRGRGCANSSKGRGREGGRVARDGRVPRSSGARHLWVFASGIAPLAATEEEPQEESEDGESGYTADDAADDLEEALFRSVDVVYTGRRRRGYAQLRHSSSRQCFPSRLQPKESE